MHPSDLEKIDRIVAFLRYDECDNECKQPCHHSRKIRRDAATIIENLANKKNDP